MPDVHKEGGGKENEVDEGHNYKGGDVPDYILDGGNHSILNSSLLSDKLNEEGGLDLREEGSLLNATHLQGSMGAHHPDFNSSILLSSKFDLSLGEVDLKDGELSGHEIHWMHHDEVPLEYGSEEDSVLSAALDEELARRGVIVDPNHGEVMRSNDFEEPMQVDNYEEPGGDNYLEEEHHSASSDDSYCNMGHSWSRLNGHRTR